LKLRYVAQSLEQMRRAKPLSAAVPPEGQDVSLPGCGSLTCPWETARQVLQKAMDPAFIDRD
jgi:hypothetical protein